MAKSPAWTRKEGKAEAGGLNAKGRASYNKANPGKPGLKAPQPEGGPRRDSFCARMKGMKTNSPARRRPKIRTLVSINHLGRGTVNMKHEVSESTKHAVDALSVVTVVGTLVEFLPAVAAIFTIVWTGIRIWETDTIKSWTGRK